MIIQHNLQAMNAQRNLGIVTGNQSKSTEKLSSGYRINRAGDDAAGLAISEKMRNQITGLNMASRNAEDGISLVQTAEGALTETHSILKRMRELAVQSANDTNTADDREQLQKEINQLTSEINRIGNTTEFNTKKLLNGNLDSIGKKKMGYEIAKQTAALSASSIGVETTGNLGVYLTKSAAGTTKGQVVFTTSALKTGTEVSYSITKTSTGLDITFSGTNTDEQEVSYTQSVTAKEDGSYEFKDTMGILKFAISKKDFAKIDIDSTVSYKSTVGTNPKTLNTNSQISSTFTGVATVTIAGSGMSGSGKALSDVSFSIDTDKNITVNMLFADGTSVIDTRTYTGSKTSGVYTYNVTHTATITLTFTNAEAGKGALSGSIDLSLFTANVTAKQVNVATGDSLGLQIGANEGQTMDLVVEDMRAAALGLVGLGANYTADATVSTGLTSDNTQHALNITNMERATNAITAIDNAINKVSSQRATLGAVQNRLEHTIANLDTSSENLQAAESRIRDVDMASEMMEYTKNNILQQAAQSMLAQANQSTQGVLSLLG